MRRTRCSRPDGAVQRNPLFHKQSVRPLARTVADKNVRAPCPMPPGLDHPHPGGMADNSPTFEHVGCAGLDVHKSLQGRLNPCEIGQSSFQDLSHCGRWFPTLKRWAILACPSGTKAWTGFGGILENQILTRHWTRMSALQLPKVVVLEKSKMRT